MSRPWSRQFPCFDSSNSHNWGRLYFQTHLLAISPTHLLFLRRNSDTFLEGLGTNGWSDTTRLLRPGHWMWCSFCLIHWDTAAGALSHHVYTLTALRLPDVRKPRPAAEWMRPQDYMMSNRGLASLQLLQPHLAVSMWETLSLNCSADQNLNFWSIEIVK